jgi:hypothetical protein
MTDADGNAVPENCRRATLYWADEVAVGVSALEGS